MINKNSIFILITVAVLLLIPFIAMQFTDEVVWTGFDFVAMGFLLLSTGLLCQFVWRKVTKIKHRIILCAVIIGIFFLIWIELAVGIFGTLFAGQ
ncbi:MAG: hypothetical protein CO119_03305 [Flavobacteriales bacterium CG_4_9_14_3_um_filter_40_17]|nr:MAG: hypothetical protein CO119_03305 [Flavobacteriales bacterium CG_4_9_14_3_um_filter_40_17]